MALNRKDRSVVPRYWLEFETTEYNKLTGKVETHTIRVDVYTTTCYV